MKTNSVPIAWVRRAGMRLDAKPFLGGAFEAKLLIEEAKLEKQPLHELTAGHKGGIFNGPMFSRNYVGQEFGVPFVGSSDMLMADLSSLPYLRRRDAESPRLSFLRLQQGMTLISCSGTIGRMVYVRPDMTDMWSSQHIMKVVPNPTMVPPGYLYAYLSSRFGLAMVTSGTYGAIIQHIESEHIADLPVPRLGDPVERKAHELVEKAARLRVSAASSLRGVADTFDATLVGVDLSHFSPRVTSVLASDLQTRMDAEFHDPVVQRIRRKLKRSSHTTIGKWCSTIFLPGIFKRIHTEDPLHGAPYYTGKALYWLEPLPKGYLAKKTSLFEDVSLKYGTILVQAFGQEGGLTGKPVWVGRNLNGATTTHMLVRLRCDDLESTAFLFGFLQSQAAYRQIAVLPFGGSIPHFNEAGISTVVIPTFGDEIRISIAAKVLEAVEARDDALVLEQKARKMVEDGIEEAA